MKTEPKKLQNWMRATDHGLPGLSPMFEISDAPILVIGASVFSIYSDLGWMPPLKRMTGDIDLSVTIGSDGFHYERLKNHLTARGYINDPKHGYRYHSPVVSVGKPTSIDLLAQPLDPSHRLEAIRVMGAGQEFSFTGFEYAKTGSYTLLGKASFPNPFGMIRLKSVSYLDDPQRRVHDFADILELIYGLVSLGKHYEFSETIWNLLRNEPETKLVLKIIQEIASNESTTWDPENARQELLLRGFGATDIEQRFSTMALEFLETLE